MVPSGPVGKVFANGPEDLISIPGLVIPPCLKLSNIRYVSRVKWSNPGKRERLPLHLGVVAFEKGAFWWPSTTVTNNFTAIYY